MARKYKVTKKLAAALQSTAADPLTAPATLVQLSYTCWLTAEEKDELLFLTPLSNYAEVKQMLACFVLLANDIPLEV